MAGLRASKINNHFKCDAPTRQPVEIRDIGNQRKGETKETNERNQRRKPTKGGDKRNQRKGETKENYENKRNQRKGET